MGEVGYFSATNKYSYVGGCPLTDSIFGLKHLVAQKNDEDMRPFNYVSAFEDLHWQTENPYALSLGFMVDSTYENWNHTVKRPEYALELISSKRRQEQTRLYLTMNPCPRREYRKLYH